MSMENTTASSDYNTFIRDMRMPRDISLEERRQMIIKYINSWPKEFFENMEIESLVQGHWSDTEMPKPYGYQIMIYKTQLSDMERVREMSKSR